MDLFVVAKALMEEYYFNVLAKRKERKHPINCSRMNTHRPVKSFTTWSSGNNTLKATLFAWGFLVPVLLSWQWHFIQCLQSDPRVCVCVLPKLCPVMTQLTLFALHTERENSRKAPVTGWAVWIDQGRVGDCGLSSGSFYLWTDGELLVLAGKFGMPHDQVSPN